jgi:hypothetical protein
MTAARAEACLRFRLSDELALNRINAKGVRMKFEAAGRALDREIAKLSAYVDKQVTPAAKRNLAKVMRQAAGRLRRLATELDRQTTGRSG